MENNIINLNEYNIWCPACNKFVDGKIEDNDILCSKSNLIIATVDLKKKTE